MPLPFILGAAAAIAGVAGVGGGIHGAVKMKEANDTMKAANARHQKNIQRFEDASERTNNTVDQLGNLELQILDSFDDFSTTIEKIQNRPEFVAHTKNGVTLPKYDREKLKQVSVGAGVLLGGLGGAAVGTAGGFAAAGATTAAVMALGTASTGTAIATLSGAAATNATLAALGGGAIAAGGGGMALGTTILGATTLGAGILVGGVIFGIVGSKLSDKADDAWDQMKKAEQTIDTSCMYLNELNRFATDYVSALQSVKAKYEEVYGYVSYIVNQQNKTDWTTFSEEEKLATQNAVLLVGLLYKMCQVNLVDKPTIEGGMNRINRAEIRKAISDSNDVLSDICAA